MTTHNEEELMPFALPKKNFDKNNFLIPKSIIKVIGVGGGGGNAVNNMYEAGIQNVEFVIANTDIQVLLKSDVPNKIQLGATLTEGLGAGNDPERGKNAAIESKQDIIDLLNDGTKMVFITAGMGGGTGTGAAPVIAQTAKEMGILTIGIVTLPFLYEGHKRLDQAIKGLNELKPHVDAIIVINNERISEVYGNLDIIQAFKHADQILTIAAKGIAEIITKPGIVNVDFADVESVMKNSGVAVMGTGYGEGNERALNAVKQAISSPLLNNNDIRGAKNMLVNIISPDENRLSTSDIKIINEYLQNKAGNSANLIWGVTVDESLDKNYAAVTVVATGFNDNEVPTLIYNQQPKNTENENNNTEVVNEEKQVKTNNSIEDIEQKVKSLKESVIDYNDDKVVDNYEQIPAYLRQNLNINFNKPPFNNNKNGNTSNNFLNPMMD